GGPSIASDPKVTDDRRPSVEEGPVAGDIELGPPALVAERDGAVDPCGTGRGRRPRAVGGGGGGHPPPRGRRGARLTPTPAAVLVDVKVDPTAVAVAVDPVAGDVEPAALFGEGEAHLSDLRPGRYGWCGRCGPRPLRWRWPRRRPRWPWRRRRRHRRRGTRQPGRRASRQRRRRARGRRYRCCRGW